MSDERIFTIIGILLISLGTLILILKLRSEKETGTFGKAASGQIIVLSVFLIGTGLIMIIKNT